MKEKDKPAPSTPESRHVVVLEDLRSQFKVFGEGLTGIREKMDEGFSKVNKQLEFLTDGLADVRIRLAKVEARLTKLEESNARLEARLTKLEESNARLEEDVRLIKQNLKVKVDAEEFNILENRVVILEKRLAALAK